MTIQKVPGRCATTLPAGTAHERPLSVTRSAAFFAPPRLPPGRGLRLCYSRDEARSIRQRIVSSARRTRRLMRPTPLPASGSLRRAGRMEETAQQAFSNAPGAARQAAARRWGDFCAIFFRVITPPASCNFSGVGARFAHGAHNTKTRRQRHRHQALFYALFSEVKTVFDLCFLL